MIAVGERPVDPRHRLGELGERQAERALLAAGYEILARRYRWSGGELDLVARRGRVLVFVEVKSRSADDAWRPAAAVDGRKQRKIVRTARHFIARSSLDELVGRFDVIEAWIDDRGACRLNWIESAFEAG